VVVRTTVHPIGALGIGKTCKEYYQPDRRTAQSELGKDCWFADQHYLNPMRRLRVLWKN